MVFGLGVLFVPWRCSENTGQLGYWPWTGGASGPRRMSSFQAGAGALEGAEAQFLRRGSKGGEQAGRRHAAPFSPTLTSLSSAFPPASAVPSLPARPRRQIKESEGPPFMQRTEIENKQLEFGPGEGTPAHLPSDFCPAHMTSGKGAEPLGSTTSCPSLLPPQMAMPGSPPQGRLGTSSLEDKLFTSPLA